LNNFLFFENRAVYDIMWKNTIELGRPQTTIWRMRNACWIPRTTNTTQNMSQKRICCSLIMSSLPLVWSAEPMTHCDSSLACDLCLQTVSFCAPTRSQGTWGLVTWQATSLGQNEYTLWRSGVCQRWE